MIIYMVTVFLNESKDSINTANHYHHIFRTPKQAIEYADGLTNDGIVCYIEEIELADEE